MKFPKCAALLLPAILPFILGGCGGTAAAQTISKESLVEVACDGFPFVDRGGKADGYWLTWCSEEPDERMRSDIHSKYTPEARWSSFMIAIDVAGFPYTGNFNTSQYLNYSFIYYADSPGSYSILVSEIVKCDSKKNYLGRETKDGGWIVKTTERDIAVSLIDKYGASNLCSIGG